MRILYVDQTSAVSGAEVVMVNSIRSLLEQGIESHVALPAGGIISERCVTLGAKVHDLGPWPDFRRSATTPSSSMIRSVPRLVRSLKTIIDEIRPDVLITNSMKAHVVGAIAARRTGVPMVARLQDVIDNQTSATTRALIRWLVGRTAVYLVPCSEAAAKALKALGLPRTRIEVVYGSPDPPSHPPVQNPPDGPVSSFTRLTRWKGLEIHLKALAIATESCGSLPYRHFGSDLFGDPAYRLEIQTLIRELGLGDAALMGETADVYTELDRSRFTVHTPVQPDPLPTTVIEAMARGRVPVVSDSGGIGEILGDVIPTLAPVGDVAETARLISFVATETTARAEFAAIAMDRYSRLFDYRVTGTAFAEILRRVG
jgi:glycosyltransferase involved in cell wall biosynthesis